MEKGIKKRIRELMSDEKERTIETRGKLGSRSRRATGMDAMQR